MVYTFIIIISRSNTILDTIKQFLTEKCPINIEKFLLFAVSVHLVPKGCTYWKKFGTKIIISRSSIMLGTTKHFLTELCTLDLEKNHFLQFRFILFANVPKGGGYVFYKHLVLVWLYIWDTGCSIKGIMEVDKYFEGIA